MQDLPAVPLPSLAAPVDSPFAWLRETAARIHAEVLDHGAVLVTGLPLDGPEALGAARAALGIGTHHLVEAFNHRTDFGNGVLSPIRWPTDRILCPIQEASFSTSFPGVVLTACVAPPERGGEALLSDCRRLADHLPARLAARVRDEGWVMTRTFHEGFGLSWQEAFSVAEAAELDRLLTAVEIEPRWLPNGGLHTTRRRPGVLSHSRTGEECWFNQLSFLNVGVLDPSERAVLADAFGDELPMNTFFGDGSPLTDQDLADLQHGYDSVRTTVPWHRGDLLIVDNILTAQGRAPSDGRAQFLVALGDRPGH